MAQQKKGQPGTLIIIGGAEKGGGEVEILEAVARQAASGKLAVATVATEEPKESFEEYQKIFRDLGAKQVVHLDVRTREDALNEKNAEVLNGAKVIFFTGGDQLRITSQLGDSLVYRRVQEIYSKGGTVAGTSAGASVMSETMLVSGNGDESHRLENAVEMAPGFGLIKDAVIDQHFAERGRLGRLLAAVAQNPRQLGIGIDENTAIVVRGQESFEVIGKGAVYVLDGSGILYSNMVEQKGEMDRTLSVYNVCLHVLSKDSRFDLRARQPVIPKSTEPAPGK
ncbi:MAG TPA: cyanophycinase [Thermoanaerobaculia bacterium]|nr:cyanophycinase [Thermoanaerobaculia bacterium]